MSVEKFKEVFSGLERAHGVYVPGEVNDSGKRGGKAFIKKEPVTPQHWIDHIEGKDPSLGIVPIMDDATCRWGCIDIDTYPLDHKKLIKSIEKLKLPLIACRSKSGGAHLFLFIDGVVSAKFMRSKLINFSALLGHADCEIFPKQIELQADRGDTGNFLNLPYHNGDETMRYAFDIKGESLLLDGFLSFVDERKITEENLKKFKTKKIKTVEELEDGPPCLRTLISVGVEEGGRDEVLYQYTVYARKKWPENWQDKISEFNFKYMKPPLGHAQVTKTINQHEKKDYTRYKCKVPPMNGRCEAAKCQLKKFGIGGDYESRFSDLQKWGKDDPVWFLNFEEHRLAIDTDTLFEQKKFRKKCMDSLTQLPNKLTEDAWTLKIQSLLQDCDEIETPEEITKYGQLDSYLYSFIYDQGVSEREEEIAIEMPWEHEGKIYFQPKTLKEYLNKKRFIALTQTEIHAHVMKDLNGGSFRKKVKGVTYYLWYVPSNPPPLKELPIPDMKKKEAY